MAGLGQHQVDRGIAAVDEVLSGLGEVSLLGLDAEATGVSLVALARLEARVAELLARLHGKLDGYERILAKQRYLAGDVRAAVGDRGVRADECSM